MDIHDEHDENVNVVENDDGTIEVELSDEYYEVIELHMKKNNFETIGDALADLLMGDLNEGE